MFRADVNFLCSLVLSFVLIEPSTRHTTVIVLLLAPLVFSVVVTLFCFYELERVSIARLNASAVSVSFP